jgi:hypothetical protein
MSLIIGNVLQAQKKNQDFDENGNSEFLLTQQIVIGMRSLVAPL